MTNIGIKERRVGQVTILDANDQVRIGLRFGASTVALSKAIQSLLEEGQDQILLDLKDVTRIDARGLGYVVSAYVSVSEKGGQMKLVHLTDRVRDLITSTKLLTVFEIYEDESQALDSFRSHVAPPEMARREMGAKHEL